MRWGPAAQWILPAPARSLVLCTDIAPAPDPHSSGGAARRTEELRTSLDAVCGRGWPGPAAEPPGPGERRVAERERHHDGRDPVAGADHDGQRRTHRDGGLRGRRGAAVGGLAAGRIVDAIGPVRTSSAADLVSGLAVAPLPILLTLDALEIWHVVLLAIVGTLADSAGSTARQGLVPAAADSGGYTRSARTPCSPRRSTSATCSERRSPACSSLPSASAGRCG